MSVTNLGNAWIVKAAKLGMCAILVASLALGVLTAKPQKAAAAENIAYGKTVMVSSTESPSYAGQYAVDANGNTRWSSAYADNQWIIVDLGATYSISSVRLAWEAAYARQYQIQVSTNNSTWTTVYENYNATGGTVTINFNPVSARYVKMYGIQRATQWGFSLWEFEVYPSNGNGGGNGVNLAYNRPVMVSSTESSSHAGQYAVDANGNTRWSSAYADNQ